MAGHCSCGATTLGAPTCEDCSNAADHGVNTPATVEDIDVGRGEIIVYYSDKSEKTIEIPLQHFSGPEGDEYEIMWDRLDPKVAELLADYYRAAARVDSDDRAVRRAESVEAC